MKLISFRYTNYRGLGSGSLAFEKDMTVIVGKNGAGKTSVLSAAALAISWIVARLRSEKANGQYIDELSITNGNNHAQLIADFDQIGEISIPNKAKQGIPKKYILDIDNLKEYASAKRQDFDTANFKTSSPVFAFYGVKRAVFDIPLRVRNNEFNLMSAYDDCLNGRANFRNFFMWFRSQEDLENEMKVRLNDPEYSSRELKAFRTALAVFMPDYKEVHISRRPLRMLVKKNNQYLNVAQLSDGEKIYFALIGDLCQRLALANPTMEDPLLGEGIVLIDELDLHLHPEWQGTMIQNLMTVFKNIQFIVSTHSPHAINHVESRCLRVMENTAISNVDYGYGMPSLVVLKDIMGLKNDEPEEVENLKRNFYSFIAAKDLDNAVKSMNELEKLVSGYPDLVTMRKIIERMSRKA